MFVSQHNTCKQPSANPVSHDTCTRELPPEFVKRAAEQLKIEQHWSQRSTLRNSLPGIGFRWGHCQVLFVSQHNTCKQPSANPVSHDTCTRELPPEFVKRAAEQLKIEQHWSQRSTLRNSLPGDRIPLGALSGLVCVPTQHLQATIGESSVSRHLHTRIAARVCETSGRAAENRATLEPTKHVAKQSSWCQIPLGALSGLVCVPTQHLQATIGESSVSRHLHTRIAARVCETSGRAAENRATLEPTKHVAKQSSW